MAKGYTRKTVIGSPEVFIEVLVRTNMHLPLLPFQFMAIHLEADPFRLHDMERLDVISRFIFRIFGHEVGEEIELL